MHKKITTFLMLGALLAGALSMMAQTSANAPLQGNATEVNTQGSRPRPDYSKKFKEGKFFYYYADEAAKTVGVAPANGMDDDMYIKHMEIPETIKHMGNTYTVTEIGPAAFGNCFYLLSVKIPNTVKYIGDRAFTGTALESITIPDGVEEIGDDCYNGCIKAKQLTIGKGLKVAGRDPFLGCWDLQNITVDPANTLYASKDGILYSKDMVTLIKCPAWRSAVTEVTLPSTVEKLGNGAFEYCEYITNIKLNEGLKEIGARAFHMCVSLKTLRFPATVEKIEDGSAFVLLRDCKQYEVAEGNTHFETMLDGQLLVDKAEKKVVSILYTMATDKLTIPEGIEAIGDKAMMVIYENNDTEYDYRGRGRYCVELPSTLKKVGVFAFSGTNIRSAKIPDGVETIPQGCFDDCKKLNYVSLGKGCKYIGEGVFNNCDAMASSANSVLRVYAVEPPALLKDKEGKDVKPFEEKMFLKTTLQVPSACLDKYQAIDTKGWSDFLKVVALEEQSAETISADAPAIVTLDGALSVSTPKAGLVTIYTVDGKQLYSTMQSRFTVELPQGIYLVTYMGKSYKALVR